MDGCGLNRIPADHEQNGRNGSVDDSFGDRADDGVIRDADGVCALVAVAGHIAAFDGTVDEGLGSRILGIGELLRAAAKRELEADHVAVHLDLSQICRPSAEGVATLKDLIDAVRADAAKLVKASDIAKAQDHLDKLKAVERIPMVRTEYAMQDDGYAEKKETKLSVQKDHFVSAPVLQNIAKEILEETKSLDAAKNEAIKLLEDKITRIGAGNRAISDYCDAIFTGVITLEGYMVAYRKSEFGIVTETILSKRGDEFPFSSIPAYQGFLSYQSLLDDDMRAAIKKSVDERYNANSPEIRATGTMLKEELADIKVQAWVMRADAFPEKAEIVDFIMKVKQQFNTFCMENGI